MNFGNAVGPVGTDTEAIQIAYHQQRWIFQGECILLQLRKCCVQVLAFALVLPAEMSPFPDIGPAFATCGLRCARSNAYHSPVGSASVGAGSSSIGTDR